MSSVVLILTEAYIKNVLEATRTWYIQHEFSGYICDIICVWHNDKFFKGDAAKFKSKRFQS